MNLNKISVLVFALSLCSTQISNGMSKVHKMRMNNLQEMINENLLQAVRDNNYDLVKNLINQGADVSYKNTTRLTPLLWAACFNQLEIVKLLVEHGADINYIRYGTALMDAAKKGNIDVVRFLLDHGANIDTIGYNGTALELAEKNGHHAVVTLIREYKAKRAKEIDEATPLVSVLVDLVEEYEGYKEPQLINEQKAELLTLIKQLIEIKIFFFT